MISPICKVKIAEVWGYTVRTQASLLFVAPRPGGTAAYLANIKRLKA